MEDEFYVYTHVGISSQEFMRHPLKCANAFSRDLDEKCFFTPSSHLFDALGQLYLYYNDKKEIYVFDSTATLKARFVKLTAPIFGRGATFAFHLAISCINGSVYLTSEEKKAVFIVEAGKSTPTTYAGGTKGHLDGPRLESRFFAPSALAATSQGTLYVVDEQYIRMIDTNGLVSTVVTGSGPFRGLTLSPLSGDLFSYASEQNQVIKITTSDYNVEIFAGSGTQGYGDGPKSRAYFSSVSRLSATPSGFLFVEESQPYRVRLIDPTDDRVSTYAEQKCEYFWYPTSLRDSGLLSPLSLATHPKTGSLHILDSKNYAVKYVNGVEVLEMDGLDSSMFSGMASFCFGSTGALYIVDKDSDSVTRVQNGVCEEVSMESDVRIYSPSSIALGPDGRIYLASPMAHRVFVLVDESSATEHWEVYAGSGEDRYQICEGSRLLTSLRSPCSLASSSTSLFVALAEEVVVLEIEFGTEEVKLFRKMFRAGWMARNLVKPMVWDEKKQELWMGNEGELLCFSKYGFSNKPSVDSDMDSGRDCPCKLLDHSSDYRSFRFESIGGLEMDDQKLFVSESRANVVKCLIPVTNTFPNAVNFTNLPDMAGKVEKEDDWTAILKNGKEYWTHRLFLPLIISTEARKKIEEIHVSDAAMNAFWNILHQDAALHFPDDASLFPEYLSRDIADKTFVPVDGESEENVLRRLKVAVELHKLFTIVERERECHELESLIGASPQLASIVVPLCHFIMYPMEQSPPASDALLRSTFSLFDAIKRTDFASLVEALKPYPEAPTLLSMIIGNPDTGMHRPQYYSPLDAGAVSSAMSHFFSDSNPDFEIVFDEMEERTVKCHAWVVAARWPLLRKALGFGGKESSALRFVMPVSAPCWTYDLTCAFVYYLYTGDPSRVQSDREKAAVLENAPLLGFVRPDSSNPPSLVAEDGFASLIHFCQRQ